MILMWSFQSLWSLTLKGLKRKVFVGKNLKSYFGRVLNHMWKISTEYAWFLKPTYWSFEHLGRLSGMARLSSLECLIAPSHLSGPTLFQKSILKPFKFKTKLIHLIPKHSLICHKQNFFRCSCDFLVGQTTTLDLQWRVIHYPKKLLWPNKKRNKIVNIKTKLNVLTNLKFIYL